MVNEEALSVMRQAAEKERVRGSNRQILWEEYTTDMMLGIFAILGSPKQTGRAQNDRRSTTALRSDFERSTGRVVMLDFEVFF